eukprot:Protomagalhaensia_wolfi_Nauph_80__2174@NODE_23_length_4810_cov_19_376441_g18_i0_p1_GENE_NODE_23_length_4810_cov_19_376441_g18_i0NODE_23_length_4810_cov_19_376441_g18_i0_p1_ORF_typecomplete_len501_score59_08_NODE_23_length_4810_cov_19_376441_g18_i017823284
MKQESAIRRPPPLHSKPARILLSPVKPKSWRSDDVSRPVPPLPLSRVMPTYGSTNRNSARSSSSSPSAASSSSASSMSSGSKSITGKGGVAVYTPEKSPRQGGSPESVPAIAKVPGLVPGPVPPPPPSSLQSSLGGRSSPRRSPRGSVSVTRSSFAFCIVQKPPSSTSSSLVAVGGSPSRSRRRRPSPSSRAMTLGRRLRGSGSRFSGTRRTSVQRLSIFKSVPKPLWLQSVYSEEETDLDEEPRRKRTDCQPLLIPVATSKSNTLNSQGGNGMTTPSRSAARRPKQMAPAAQPRPARRASVTGVSPASSLKGKPPRRASIAAASGVMNAASVDRPRRLPGSPRQTRSIPLGLTRRLVEGPPPLVSSPRRNSLFCSQPSALTARLSDASTSDKTFRAANSARSCNGGGGGLVLLNSARKALSPPGASLQGPPDRTVRRTRSSRPAGEPSILDRVNFTAKLLPELRRRPERRTSKPSASRKLIESRRCRHQAASAASAAQV